MRENVQKRKKRKRYEAHFDFQTSPLVPPSFSIKQTIFWMKAKKNKNTKKQWLACYLHAKYPHPVQTLMPDPKAICSSNQHMRIRLKRFSNKETNLGAWLDYWGQTNISDTTDDISRACVFWIKEITILPG